LRRTDLGDHAGRGDRQRAGRGRQDAGAAATEAERDVLVDADRRHLLPLRVQQGQRIRLEGRIQRLDALDQRRMRGHHRGQAQALAEQHVAHFLGVGVAELRTFRQAGELLQRAGEAARLPRELHRRGIREQLALAAQAGLDQAAEEHADVSR
jgi:hypothetical protein